MPVEHPAGGCLHTASSVARLRQLSFQELFRNGKYTPAQIRVKVIREMSIINRVYVDDVISTYFEMGMNALERKEFGIAQKMFKAVFDEPSSKAQKEKVMLQLLIRSAEAHEGLKQLYKAKLLYIRALALLRKSSGSPTMQAVDLLCRLSRLTAQQGLYRQSVDFAQEAYSAYKACSMPNPIDFVRSMRLIERIMQLKGRTAEQERLLQIMYGAKTEALQSIPNVASFIPSTLAVSI